MLARAKNVPLVAGRVQRLPGVRFRVLTEIVHVPHTDDRQADILDTTAAIHAVFERWIREDPGPVDVEPSALGLKRSRSARMRPLGRLRGRRWHVHIALQHATGEPP